MVGPSDWSDERQPAGALKAGSEWFGLVAFPAPWTIYPVSKYALGLKRENQVTLKFSAPDKTIVLEGRPGCGLGYLTRPWPSPKPSNRPQLTYAKIKLIYTTQAASRLTLEVVEPTASHQDYFLISSRR